VESAAWPSCVIDGFEESGVWNIVTEES